MPGGLHSDGLDQAVARSVVRDQERSLSCLTNQATHGAEGAARLAGLMSQDAPTLLLHTTAREYALTGNTALACGVRMPGEQGTGRPLELSFKDRHIEALVAEWASRTARFAAGWRACAG